MGELCFPQRNSSPFNRVICSCLNYGAAWQKIFERTFIIMVAPVGLGQQEGCDGGTSGKNGFGKPTIHRPRSPIPQ
jgi:hypothetical protein